MKYSNNIHLTSTMNVDNWMFKRFMKQRSRDIMDRSIEHWFENKLEGVSLSASGRSQCLALMQDMIDEAYEKSQWEYKKKHLREVNGWWVW